MTDLTANREVRLEIRRLEAAITKLHLASARMPMFADTYLRRAWGALHQAEKAMALAEDPSLEPLENLTLEEPARYRLRRKR